MHVENNDFMTFDDVHNLTLNQEANLGRVSAPTLSYIGLTLTGTHMTTTHVAFFAGILTPPTRQQFYAKRRGKDQKKGRFQKGQRRSRQHPGKPEARKVQVYMNHHPRQVQVFYAQLIAQAPPQQDYAVTGDSVEDDSLTLQPVYALHDFPEGVESSGIGCFVHDIPTQHQQQSQQQRYGDRLKRKNYKKFHRGQCKYMWPVCYRYQEEGHRICVCPRPPPSTNPIQTQVFTLTAQESQENEKQLIEGMSRL